MVQVQIVENWSDIEGVICGSHPSRDLRDHTVVEIRVDKVKPVEDYPNLLGESEGKTIEVLVRQETLSGIDVTEDRKVVCRVRRAGPKKIFAHPERFETKAP